MIENTQAYEKPSEHTHDYHDHNDRDGEVRALSRVIVIIKITIRQATYLLSRYSTSASRKSSTRDNIARKTFSITRKVVEKDIQSSESFSSLRRGPFP